MRDLNLLVLRCSDIEKARTFYECLGLRFVRHAHGTGPEHYAHEDEQGVLELYPTRAMGSADQTGLGFAVKQMKDLFRRLESRGFLPEPIRHNAWGETFVVRDPDGRRVEMKQA